MVGQGFGWDDPTAGRALDCVRDLLELDDCASSRLRGLMILCRFGADLVDADAAAHIRRRRDAALAHWCVWSRRSSAPPVLECQRERPAAAGQDWWIVSVSRRHVYDQLGAGHLAELPMRTDTASPSLVVLKRSHPFDDGDSELLARSRSALLLIETLIDRLLPARPKTAPAESYAVVLTSREHEVLEMLSEGLLARSIAARLDVSERTVHKHLGSVYRKLDAHDRLLAVRRAESLGLLTASPREAVPAG